MDQVSKESKNRFASTRFGRIVDFARATKEAPPIRLGYAAAKRLIEQIVADGETYTDRFYEALTKGVCDTCDVRTGLEKTLNNEIRFSPARSAPHEVAAVDLADRAVCVGDIVYFTRITITFCPVRADGKTFVELASTDKRLSAKLWFRAIPLGRSTDKGHIVQLTAEEAVSAMIIMRDHRKSILDTICEQYKTLTADFIEAEIKAENAGEFQAIDKGSISLFVLDAGYESFQAFTRMMDRAASADEISFDESSQVAERFDLLLNGILKQKVLERSLSSALARIKSDRAANVVDLVESEDRNGEMSLHFAIYTDKEAEFFGVARAKEWRREFETEYRKTFSKEEKLAPSRSPANKATAIMSNDLVINL